LKTVLSYFRTGIFGAIPLAVIAALLNWFFSLSFSLVDYSFVENAFLNNVSKAGLLSAVLMVYGWLLQQCWFINFLSRLPFIGPYANLIFNSDFINRLKKGNFPEAIVRLRAGDFQVIVMNKIDGTDRYWVFVMSSPAPFSGYLTIVPERDIWLTGRTSKEAFATVITYGLNCSFPNGVPPWWNET
jgi:uncharacterized membrane protein